MCFGPGCKHTDHRADIHCSGVPNHRILSHGSLPEASGFLPTVTHRIWQRLHWLNVRENMWARRVSVGETKFRITWLKTLKKKEEKKRKPWRRWRRLADMFQECGQPFNTALLMINSYTSLFPPWRLMDKDTKKQTGAEWFWGGCNWLKKPPSFMSFYTPWR